MTQTQKALFEKFLNKALAEGIYIIGKGTIKKTGQQFYAVSSSDGTGCYAVTVEGQALTCNCPAGRSGHYCKHRALARHEIIAHAAAKPAPTPSALPERMTEDDWDDHRANAPLIQAPQGVHLYRS